MKKIISFSLFGNYNAYIKGAYENIKKAKEIYPEWICRFYCSSDIPNDIIINLENHNNTEVIIIKSDLPHMTWRFLAIDDEDVEIMLSRDCNSVVSFREKECVDVFINSDENFKNNISRIDLYIKNSDEKFYITSNNQYALDILSKNTNVTIHTFDNIEELPNNHGYYSFNKKIDREILIKRLNDNLSEMVYLSHFKNLYYYTSYSWLSSFLYYPLVNNNEIKLIDIKTKI